VSWLRLKSAVTGPREVMRSTVCSFIMLPVPGPAEISEVRLPMDIYDNCRAIYG
jgi:hypothetical protein